MPIFYTITCINQENNEIFLLGQKPPGPNREMAETSWGRTGKGPNPLAFVNKHSHMSSTARNLASVNRPPHLFLISIYAKKNANYICPSWPMQIKSDLWKVPYMWWDIEITENDRCVIKKIGIHCYLPFCPTVVCNLGLNSLIMIPAALKLCCPWGVVVTHHSIPSHKTYEYALIYQDHNMNDKFYPSVLYF